MNSKRRRIFIASALAAPLLLVLALPASAGQPHFTKVEVERVDDTLVVEGKEAGLGNEDQVHIVVTALAECVNPGKKKPSADNKSEVSASGDFPVQNGKAEFVLVVADGIDPDCSPPMEIVFSGVTIEDETNGVTAHFPGPF